MKQVTTVGLDIAKRVFQLHGVDAAGQVVIRRKLRRDGVLVLFAQLPPCLIGLEACATPITGVVSRWPLVIMTA